MSARRGEAALADGKSYTSELTGELEARVRHFARLRAARRALLPSVSTPGVLPSREHLQRLGKLIQGLSRSGNPDPEALAQVDEMLGIVAEQLLAALEGVSMAQIRATLGSTADTQRAETLALLDLIAQATCTSDRHIRVVEYLATLLSSECCGDVRGVVEDPVVLCGGMAALCAQQLRDAEGGPDIPGTVAGLQQAAKTVPELLDMRPLLRETRELKESLGARIFIPELLREIVRYNVAVWNRQEALLEEERTADCLSSAELLYGAEFELDLDDLTDTQSQLETPRERGAAAAAAAAEPAETSEREAHSGPVELDARYLQALRSVEAEITCRLFGGTSLGGAWARIADVLDGDALEEHECLAFHPDSSGGDELVRTIIATGLLLQKLPEIREPLSELDLAPAFIRGQWIQQLTRKIRETATLLVSCGRLAEAQELSRAKSRFLVEALTDLIRDRAEEARLKGAAWTGPIEGAADLLSEARASVAPSYAGRMTEIVARPRSYAVALGVLLVIAFIWRVSMFEASPFRIFEGDELRELSRRVLSGYRDHAGESPLFVGTVTATWDQLSAGQQRAEGMRTYQGLSGDGVREVRLYDDERKLRFHMFDGRIRVPEADN